MPRQIALKLLILVWEKCEHGKKDIKDLNIIVKSHQVSMLGFFPVVRVLNNLKTNTFENFVNATILETKKCLLQIYCLAVASI